MEREYDEGHNMVLVDQDKWDALWNSTPIDRRIPLHTVGTMIAFRVNETYFISSGWNRPFPPDQAEKLLQYAPSEPKAKADVMAGR